MGYIQSRYSYYPDRKVRFIADNFRERRIPCDGIFLDIDYMDGFRIFTWDKSRFPDPHRMLADLRQEGFHIIAIVDPYVKVDPNYWVYQQGLSGSPLPEKTGWNAFHRHGLAGRERLSRFCFRESEVLVGLAFPRSTRGGHRRLLDGHERADHLPARREPGHV